MTPTGPLFIVICGQREPYVRERDVQHCDRATTVRHVAEKQFAEPFRIIGFNLATRDSWDATESIMTEAQWLREDTPTRPGIAERWDVERAAREMV